MSLSVKENYEVLTLLDLNANKKGQNLVLTSSDYIIQPGNQLPAGFYKNSATYNRLDKTPYLAKVADIQGTFRSDLDILHPIMRYPSDTLPDFNYAIIEELNNRCYYIDKVTYIAKGLWQLDMSIDVLMTYKDAILNLKTFVTRNQFDYNTLIPDDRLPLQQGQNITYDIIPNELFGNTGSFVLQGLLLTPGDLQPETSSSSDIIGTWVLNDTPNLVVDINNKPIEVTFVSDETVFTTFMIKDYTLINYSNSEGDNYIYNTDHYVDEVFKTISITSIDMSQTYANNFYYWLKANAQRQTSGL